MCRLFYHFFHPYLSFCWFLGRIVFRNGIIFRVSSLLLLFRDSVLFWVSQSLRLKVKKRISRHMRSEKIQISLEMLEAKWDLSYGRTPTSQHTIQISQPSRTAQSHRLIEIFNGQFLISQEYKVFFIVVFLSFEQRRL